jgi:hypothetical protein
MALAESSHELNTWHSGGAAWWRYIMGEDEKQRLDHLMGMALLDETIRYRLVEKRDTSLLSDSGLSKETQTWLRTLPATSLTELAQAIISTPPRDLYSGA